MTKKEMKRNLDRMMMTLLEGAIKCADKGQDYCFTMYNNQCVGVLHSAMILGLLTEKEFDNINHTLCFMKGVD